MGSRGGLGHVHVPVSFVVVQGLDTFNMSGHVPSLQGQRVGKQGRECGALPYRHVERLGLWGGFRGSRVAGPVAYRLGCPPGFVPPAIG